MADLQLRLAISASWGQPGNPFFVVRLSLIRAAVNIMDSRALLGWKWDPKAELYYGPYNSPSIASMSVSSTNNTDCSSYEPWWKLCEGGV